MPIPEEIYKALCIFEPEGYEPKCDTVLAGWLRGGGDPNDHVKRNFDMTGAPLKKEPSKSP